jgi:hypothetical protein
VLALTPSIAGATDVHSFDGEWFTTVSCSAARDALGYSFRFVSTVKDGVFHGLQGIEGEPSSLQIDGKIESDGTGKLYAKGRTGSKEFVPGRDAPRGTEYGYNIDAHFDASSGTGTRIEGRPCSFQFTKQ